MEAVPLTPPGKGAWIDSSTLLWSRGERQNTPRQLWWLSYPTGQLARLTNDLSSYEGISLTADRERLVTARTQDRIDIWIGDGMAISGADAVSDAARTLVSGSSLAWSNGRLLYTARSGGSFVLSAFLPDRGMTQEIVADAESPATTSDGRTIVYVSKDDNTLNTLWKADADGRRRTPLVQESVSWPVITPDDRHVIYASAFTCPAI